MIFLIFITFIVGLQFLHRRLLHQLFHPKYDRWVILALALIHLPLAVYMGIRLTGGGQSAANCYRNQIVRPVRHLAFAFPLHMDNGCARSRFGTDLVVESQRQAQAVEARAEIGG